ncbi:MAG: hypothetical protein WCB02_09010, partial [Bradyrhizobium sp.]
MTRPDVITTRSGDRMVLVPFEEYERLGSRRSARVDEIERRLATGEEELIRMRPSAHPFAHPTHP